MNYENILNNIADGEKLSKLLSFKDVGDGIVGELFETYIYNQLKGKSKLKHIGMSKSKADIIIDNVEFSCKVKGIKSSPTKVHHNCNQLANFEKLNKIDKASWLLKRIKNMPFIFLVDNDSYGYVSISSIDKIISKIKTCEFNVNKNKNSFTILFEDKASINVSNEYIYLNKSCFKTIIKEEFRKKHYSAYDILEELLK